LPADPDDARYWGEGSVAACGCQVRIRLAPANLPPSASASAEKLRYMRVEKWRSDDLAHTCRRCLDGLDAELRAVLGVKEAPVRVVG
jgi:hypothetical protein